MASPRPVASRDGLNKFVRSFEKFATLEDLVDTDSESESENESGSVVWATATPLEGALLNSLAKAGREDNVEDVLSWVSLLTHQDVLKCVSHFADTLDGFVNPSDLSTLALREFLTASNKAPSDRTDVLNSNLVTLLVDAGTGLPPVVHFLLLLLNGQNSDAASLITNLVATLRELTTLTTLSKDVTSDTKIVSQHIVTLQYMLKLLQAHIFGGQDVTTAGNRNTHTFSTTQTRLSLLLKDFAHQYTALFPILGCAVRAAVFQCALRIDGGTNYGLLEGLLGHPVSEATLQEAFATLSTVNTTKCSIINTDAVCSVGASATKCVNIGKVDVPYRETPTDEGYVYLQNLSREETIKTLYPLPAGSFLLRPHETSSSQYFLSFRTVGSTTNTTSSSSSSNSTSAGKNSNGRLSPESTVKHAIIRKTYTPASVPTIPVDTTTMQPASPMKPCTGEDGNTSPLPMLLRQPPVHSTSTNTSRNATMSEISNFSAASESDHGGYVYQCGKIGPCATMIEMLRQISSVLETPLIFTPLTTTATTVSNPSSTSNAAATKTKIGTKNATMADGAVVLDINHSFWAHLQARLQIEPNSNTKRNHLPLPAANSTVCDIPGSAWSLAAHANVMLYMYDMLLRTLSVRRFVSQMAADLGLCEKLVQNDLLYTSHLPGVSSDNSENTGTGSSSVRVSVFRAYKCLLDVTAAPEKRTIRRERTEGTNNVTTTLTSPIVTNSTTTMSAKISNKTVFAPVDELLLAEHLISHISACVGTRSVRLSNAAGTEHVTLPHCLPAEDVHRLLTQWWEVYVQHESTVAQRVSARRMSERINMKHAATAAKSNKTENFTADGIVDPNTVNTTAAATTKAVTSIKDFDQDFKLHSTIDYETSIVSTTTTTTSSTLSLSLYTILKRIHSLLSIDMTCKGKDYVAKMVAWVSDELQIVYEVVKPGEYAFSAATRYYCPHHPYEVKVLRDYAQASERVRLGRHVFGSVGQSTSNNNTSTNFKTEQKQGGGGSSVYKSNYFAHNVENVLRDEISAQQVQQAVENGPTALLAESGVKEVARLWNLLGAEQYLTSAIAHAAELSTREQLPVRYPAPTPDTTSSTTTTTNNNGVSLQTPTLANSHNASLPPKESTSEYNSYLGAMQRALYHNALYSRLGFATRSIPIVQVDIYALQEILAVRSMQVNSAQAPVAIPSGVSPLTYMNLFNKPTVLTPTASAHGSGALETYTVMRLAHKTSHNNDHTANANNSSLHH
eukprot:gene16754-19103_t